MHHGAHGKLKLFHLEDGGFNHQRDYKNIIKLTLVESEAKKVPNIERGKQIFQEIIKSKMQSSSPDDQEWYNEYLAALDISSDMSHLNQNPIEIVNHPALQMQGLRLRHQCLSYS
ncbi:hypothetical protein [Rickettsia endosymbiont of Nabis limbatus]|uniref:hypothetical protein n=1 Tax=Rickettsia endosymbiont of Nabis limbatus TaxID=3066268 RepID=UPI003AF361A5